MKANGLAQSPLFRHLKRMNFCDCSKSSLQISNGKTQLAANSAEHTDEHGGHPQLLKFTQYSTWNLNFVRNSVNPNQWTTYVSNIKLNCTYDLCLKKGLNISSKMPTVGKLVENLRGIRKLREYFTIFFQTNSIGMWNSYWLTGQLTGTMDVNQFVELTRYLSWVWLKRHG